MIDPFDNLEVKATTAKGREWFFHMSPDGKIFSKAFSSRDKNVWETRYWAIQRLLLHTS